MACAGWLAGQWFGVVALIVVAAAGGCGSAGGRDGPGASDRDARAAPADGGGKPGRDAAGATGGLALELHDTGFYSLRKPKGWDVHTAGSCTTLAFVARDPAQPLRQVFYFGTLGPFYRSAERKQFDQTAAHGDPAIIPWVDAPVVTPLTPEGFVEAWPQLARMHAAAAFMAEFPSMDEARVVGSAPQPALLAEGQTALLRLVFRHGSAVGEGQLLVTVTPFLGASGLAYANLVLGATAPAGDFDAIEARLVEALDSFTLTQDYFNFCLRQQQASWGAVAAAGRTLSEASDIVAEGWQARSRTEDVTAYKGIDAYRGEERLYDASSGTVYLAEAGWYEQHRDALELKRLEALGSANLPADTLWNLYRTPARPQSEIR